MALDPQNLPSDRAARQLARIYQRASRDLAHQIERALLAGSMATAQNRRRQLAAVVRYLDELGVQTDPMARQAVSQALTDGDTLARADVKRLGAQVTPLGEQTWHTVNREAAEAAGDQLTMELRNARQVVAASTNDLFRREAARETVRALTGVEGSPAAARRQLVKDLRARGLTAFVDRAGRRWKLQDYADMAVRTATRTAVVTGQIQRLAAHNITLARVSSHASACQICQPHEDRLIDITGTGRSEFLGEPVADGPLPPFHPRCVMPGSTVSGRGIYAALRAVYEGDAIELTTRGAHRLTVTPNHPVMTPAGWLPASDLREGDHIFSAADARSPLARAGEEDLDYMPTAIEDVFQTFAARGIHASVPAAGDDLHGDAGGVEGKVDVVLADRRLLDILHAKVVQEFGELELMRPGERSGASERFGASGELLGASATSSRRCVGCGRGPWADANTVPGEVLAHRALRDVCVDGEVIQTLTGEVPLGVAIDVRDGDLASRRQAHLFGTSANPDAKAFELGAYAGRARAEVARAVGEGDARGVQLDELVGVNRIAYSGHVYDLSSIDGSYQVDTCIVSNCAHTIMGVSEQVERLKRGAEQRDAGGGTSSRPVRVGDVQTEAMRAIRQTLPDATDVPVRRLATTDPTFLGRYTSASGGGPLIELAEKGAHPHLTFAHEYAHYLVDAGRITPDGVRTIVDATKSTSLYRDLYKAAQTHRHDGERLTALTVSQITYWLGDDELLARAFAQHVAQTTGGRMWRRELKRAAGGQRITSFWNETDFARVALALSQIVSTMGER